MLKYVENTNLSVPMEVDRVDPGRLWEFDGLAPCRTPLIVSVVWPLDLDPLSCVRMSNAEIPELGGAVRLFHHTSAPNASTLLWRIKVHVEAWKDARIGPGRVKMAHDAYAIGMRCLLMEQIILGWQWRFFF